jgi:hypothetical protein
MRKDVWTTYAVDGVHLHQVKRMKSGGWKRRVLQGNGSARAAGPVQSIADSEGEAIWEEAKARSR